jgi:hypothetical protein
MSIIMNILIMQSPVIFFLLGPQILPSVLFSDTVNMQVCSSIKVK